MSSPKLQGPVMPYEVWWERLPKATRPSWEPMQLSEEEKRLNSELIAQTEGAVIEMARHGEHGRNIRDYLVCKAPITVDPAQFIQSMVDRKLIFKGSLDPYSNQYAGGLYGNPICHPTHYRYWAP